MRGDNIVSGVTVFKGNRQLVVHQFDGLGLAR
jgi:hypothetical protein